MSGTLYDEVPFDSDPCAPSHPDGLAAIGCLLGLAPAPVTACRVLELGCGTGANLLPMACALPGSRFLGLDLSSQQIRTGRQESEALGLENLELRQGDLAATRDLGTFDYVLAHGVYSWVPPAVQEALLRLAAQSLGPHGVAYVSYTTSPGAWPRQALREMLAFHTRDERGPAQRVARARRFAAAAALLLPDRSPVRRLMAELGGMSDAYLLHDYLSQTHEALTVTEFVRRAAGHGLAYLGDAQLHTHFPSDLDPEAFQELAAEATSRLELEQLLDHLRQRPFRTTLLCRAEATPDLAPTQERLRDLFVTTRAQARGHEDAHWLFRGPDGEVFGTPSPLVARAFETLIAHRPRPVAFQELVGSHPSPSDVEALGAELLAAAAAGQVTLGTWDRGIAEPGEGARPFAAARRQAQRGEGTVTNLWHERVALGPEQRRALLGADDPPEPAALAALAPLALLWR